MRNLTVLLIFIVFIVGVSSAQSGYCGLVDLSFQHNATTTPVGYEELINYPSGNPEVDENVSIKNTDGPVLIDSYITPEGALYETTDLLKGLRSYRMYHWVDSNPGTTQGNYSVYLRKANGTEIYVYSALSADVNSLTPLLYETNYVKQSDSKIEPTDRIVIKVYGQTTHSSPVVFHFVYQGDVRASFVSSGYFVCKESTNDQSSYAPSAIMFSLIGGFIGALIIIKRRNFK